MFLSATSRIFSLKNVRFTIYGFRQIKIYFDFREAGLDFLQPCPPSTQAWLLQIHLFC